MEDKKKEKLYRMIKLPNNEPVQFVGCYVLKWGKIDQATVGFIEAEEGDVSL